MNSIQPLYEDYLKMQIALQRSTSATDLQPVIKRLKKFFSGGTRNELYPVFHPRVKTPIYLRRGTSDVLNFVQIFVKAEYSPCFLFPPENIIDLGSYIGLSALYFANRFPEAKIICVEPSPANYQMLKLNTKAYQNITTIKAGVWSHKTKLKIARQVSGDWGNIIEETNHDDSEAINALSITDIISKYKMDKIDFLKIDIEGTEKQVFLNNTENWVELVRSVACETHDRFVPGCTDAYENLFKSRGFDYFQSGEFKTFVKREFALSNPLVDPIKL